MNGKEKEGVEFILRRMPQPDLFSLATTITNRRVHVETVDEAVNAILRYAVDGYDVLKRRKMKNEYVHQYLIECGRVLPATSDKNTVVRAALELWQSNALQGDIDYMEEDIDMDDVPANNSSVGHVTDAAIRGGNNNANVNFQTELQTMSHQFVKWFYPLLNNGHVANADAADNFGPHHFWRDCRLRVSSPQYERLAEGDETVSRTLLELIGEHQLYFNPFDAEPGVRCECDPHGLVVVVVGGSVHRGDDESVGIFEQKFGLIRDPSSDNSWKIKFTELQLWSKDLNFAFPSDEQPLPIVDER